MSSFKPERRNWKDIKIQKQKRRYMKEKNLLKKIKKQKLKNQEAQAAEESQSSTNTNEYSTISIALAGTILENSQTADLRSYLVARIARAAVLFEVDEIIIFDDYGDDANARKSTFGDSNGDMKTVRHSCAQFGRILQYLECPKYLRKFFFPRHYQFEIAEKYRSINPPHHLGPDNTSTFREGYITNKPVKKGRGSQVYVGLQQDVHVDKLITPGMRCTVKLFPQEEGRKKLKGMLVSPTTPRRETGVYWGYNVRVANSLSEVFSQCPFKDERYDVTIGTSDKGTSIDEFQLPPYKHLLLVFGGIHGLEQALESDSVLTADDPASLFNYYLNMVPNQGVRTIRTEEAVLISLTELNSKKLRK